jgi:diadenosine tetraphosphate (Ap4A) HIT family hydrolase
MRADGYNIGVNTGLAAGQVIEHTHVHIIPRRTDDGLVSWPHTDTTPEDLLKIAADIRAVETLRRYLPTVPPRDKGH